MNPEIERICGLSDYIPDFEAIGNNPNYVFTNDPNYLTVQLLDSNGSVINVNSWIECANYVNGGWNSAYYSGIKSELIFLSITIFYSFGYFFYKKRELIKNVNEK